MGRQRIAMRPRIPNRDGFGGLLERLSYSTFLGKIPAKGLGKARVETDILAAVGAAS